MQIVKSRTAALDILITAIIVVIGCVGMGVASVNRVDKNSGTITIDNYEDYLQAGCRIGTGHGGGNEMDFKYTFYIVAAPYRAISDLEISVEIISKYSDFEPLTLHIGYLDPSSPYTFSDTVHYTFPFYTLYPTIPEVAVNVVSISGVYDYTLVEG